MKLGLRAKLVILVIAGITTGFTVVGAIRIYTEKQRITEDIRREAGERAALIAEAVTNLLVGYDYSNMESLAERIVFDTRVYRVTIRNKAGKTMVDRADKGLPAAGLLSVSAPVLFNQQNVGTVELQVSLERLDQLLDATYRAIALEQVFFGVLLGLMIYWATSRVILNPLGRISQRMKMLAATPHISQPEKLTIDSRDEIGTLAAAFNALNEQIFQAQCKLHAKIDLADSALVISNQTLEARSTELEQRTRELERALSLVERLAITDSLTALKNRRYLDETLTTALSRASRYHEPLALALIDVDNFKEINDRFGHAAGDKVLQVIADQLKNRTRESDIAARIGGDEFAILFFRTTAQQAGLMLETLRQRISGSMLCFDGQEVSVAVSVGVADNSNAMSVEGLYLAADRGLYSAKRGGKNRVACEI